MADDLSFHRNRCGRNKGLRIELPDVRMEKSIIAIDLKRDRWKQIQRSEGTNFGRFMRRKKLGVETPETLSPK
jgi:hypothetical protein